MIYFFADDHYGVHPGKNIFEKLPEELKNRITFVENNWELLQSGEWLKDCELLILNMIGTTCNLPHPDENAEKVIKKIHKSKTKEITRLIKTYQVPEKWLSDYGYYPLPKGGYVEYESDSNLRDDEKIPVKEDIYTYFMREVRPYVDDAWINLPATKIGCDISFNKYFYKPEPLRSLEENERDIRILEEQSQGLIQSLFA